MGHTSNRFDVRSADGTPIAVWVEGSGPPLVMVHGALSDHQRFFALAAELRPHVTMFAVDRRGRGASGDAAEYTIEREFEDVAAVVDAVHERTDRLVSVWGHSYGADCAMGAAAISRHVGRLVLYEPGLGMQCPDDALEAVEAAVAAGDREAAAVAVLSGVVGATTDEVAAMRSSPIWPSRLDSVHTVARELRAESEWVYRPGQFDAITAPTVVLAGSDSPPEQTEATGCAAAAIPGARTQVLDGHGHFAFQSDPAMVARVIRECLA